MLNVLERSNDEARRFNHEYIGTEHILMALMKEDTGVCADILKSLGTDEDRVCREIESLMKLAPYTDFSGKRPRTPRANRAIDLAVEEARNLGHSAVDVQHLLIALVRENDGLAAMVLLHLGITAEDVRREVQQRQRTGSQAG